MNEVVLIGRLTRDPELRYLPSTQTPRCQFTLAVDRNLTREKRQELEAKGRPTADFIRIIVWGRQAETCANYLAKGRLVAVSGRIETGSYDAQDGTRRYTTDVVANRVQFLEFGERTTSNYSDSGYTNQTQSQAFAPQGQRPQTPGGGGLGAANDFFDDDFVPADDGFDNDHYPF